MKKISKLREEILVAVENQRLQSFYKRCEQILSPEQFAAYKNFAAQANRYRGAMPTEAELEAIRRVNNDPVAMEMAGGPAKLFHQLAENNNARKKARRKCLDRK